MQFSIVGIIFIIIITVTSIRKSILSDVVQGKRMDEQSKFPREKQSRLREKLSRRMHFGASLDLDRELLTSLSNVESNLL